MLSVLCQPSRRILCIRVIFGKERKKIEKYKILKKTCCCVDSDIGDVREYVADVSGGSRKFNW